MTATARPGRPREFDDQEALAAAMRLFHEKGYHATAVSDLMKATGLHKSSLYSAFGDKHKLFVAALNRYVSLRAELLRADLEHSRSPLDGLRAYLLRQATEAVQGRGCMSANAALELLPGDPDVDLAVSRHQRLTQDLLAGALDAARAAGEIPPDRDTATLATFLFAVVQGLWDLGRTSDDPARLIGVAEAAVRGLQ